MLEGDIGLLNADTRLTLERISGSAGGPAPANRAVFGKSEIELGQIAYELVVFELAADTEEISKAVRWRSRGERTNVAFHTLIVIAHMSRS
jgi:hypothetical protein